MFIPFKVIFYWLVSCNRTFRLKKRSNQSMLLVSKSKAILIVQTFYFRSCHLSLLNNHWLNQIIKWKSVRRQVNKFPSQLIQTSGLYLCLQISVQTIVLNTNKSCQTIKFCIVSSSSTWELQIALRLNYWRASAVIVMFYYFPDDYITWRL